MVEVHDIGQPRIQNPLGHLPALGRIDPQRFFAIDRLAGFDRGQDITAMALRGAGDIDRGDGRIGEYPLGVFDDRQARVLRRRRGAGGLARIPSGGDDEAVVRPRRGRPR
jgi:hypothetical protein